MSHGSFFYEFQTDCMKNCFLKFTHKVKISLFDKLTLRTSVKNDKLYVTVTLL